MTKEFICRLCGNDYSDEFFEIYDDDGNPNEGYRITANFFNSRVSFMITVGNVFNYCLLETSYYDLC